MTLGTAARRATVVLRLALTALTRNRLRTTLTGVGIAIGTTAVISTVAIGEGGAAQIHEQFLLLGDNLVWFEAGGRTVNGLRTGTGSTPTLVLGDMHAILEAAPALKSCSPQVDSSVQVIHGNLNWHTAFRGVAPEYDGAAEQADVGGGDDLLGGEDVAAGDRPTADLHDFIMLPYTTAERKLKGVTWFDDIMCSATSPDEIPGVMAAVLPLLRARHHIGPGEPDDFNIRRPEDIIKAQEDTARTLTALLASVAAISLLVGGVGIMNIMLVSVSERTREIGLRMAVGARERDIRRQFLTEAIVLCLGGCAAGVLGGVLLSRAIAETLSWPLLLSPTAVLVAVGASLATGVAFGYYPARRASQKDPIEALRSE